jgi:hypothetical protein
MLLGWWIRRKVRAFAHQLIPSRGARHHDLTPERSMNRRVHCERSTRRMSAGADNRSKQRARAAAWPLFRNGRGKRHDKAEFGSPQSAEREETIHAMVTAVVIGHLLTTIIYSSYWYQ